MISKNLTIDEMIQLAFQEDLPHGDITTDSLDVINRPGTAKLIAKSDLYLSGQSVFEKCVLFMEPQCQLRWMFKMAKSFSQTNNLRFKG